MNEQFIKKILFMVSESGKTALRLMADSQPRLKPDQSVLTRADTAISEFMKQELKELLETGDHILIDEEDNQNARYFDQARINTAPYIWVIDPIDATRVFANQLPLFGISVGLLKEGRPWLGAVYLPALGELFYCDGENSYFVSKAFTAAARKTVITPVDQEITRQSLFLGTDSLIKDFGWDYSCCQVLLPACAVIALCWPTVGRGCGCFFNAHLWDFAGSWPIWRCAGLELRTVSSGRSLEALDTALFKGTAPQPWRICEPHILSSERNYPLIKNCLTSGRK